MAGSFITHDPDFKNITGDSPSLELLEEKEYAFAHEAGVFIPSRDELFITSNRLRNIRGEPYVELTKVTLRNDEKGVKCETISPNGLKQTNGEIDNNDGIFMANGGVNYKDNILICAQGSMSKPSGLFEMSTVEPYGKKLIIADFFGRPFNSVNDVVVHTDGSIWFTDPCYGYEQRYRPKPSLPSQVYRHDVESEGRNIRAVADGFGHPNGLCFSPDEKILYVTDTDRVCGDGNIDDTKSSTMYAQQHIGI